MDEAERERNPRPHVASAADHQVVGADVDDAQGDGRLDDVRRRVQELERGERERHAMGRRKRTDDERELAERAAQEQQANQKEQMVGTDQDMVHAGRHEPSNDRQRPLPAAGIVLESRVRRGPESPARRPSPVRRSSRTSGVADRKGTSWYRRQSGPVAPGAGHGPEGEWIADRAAPRERTTHRGRRSGCPRSV